MIKQSLLTRVKQNFVLPMAGLFLAICPGVALSENIAISQINAAVEGFLSELHSRSKTKQQRLEVKVGYIDPRLNLPVCEQSLFTELNGSSSATGRVQVKVSCNGQRSWSKYIAAEVNLYEEVAVATTSLRRGKIIESGHIELAEVNLSNLRRTPVFDTDSVLGMKLKYPLTAGEAYSLDALELPVVVERGDLVQMIAETQNLRIKQQGEALQNGAVGTVINVKNSNSEMVVQAEVISPGKVKVQL